MMKRESKTILRIACSAVLFVLGLLLPIEGYWRLLIYIPAYLIVGFDILYKAARNLLRGNALDENFLMTVATVGAFVIGEYPEGVAVMLFYQVGELFNDMAVAKSRKSIQAVLSMRPDAACVLRDGQEITVDPYDVQPEEVILVRAGERVPLDGVLLEGECRLDTSALTGESLPREIETGGAVASGCINLSGVIRLRVSGSFEESTVNRILELVESASNKKARTENFITRFAKYYTPIVVGLAVLLAVIPSLVDGDWATWVHRGLVFLVVSCPCALVISVPLSFFSGLGASAKAGIMIKGSNYLEALSQLEAVAFDKTGTLTKGSFEVTDIHIQHGTKEQLLAMAASAEYYSTHPIAQSIVRTCAQAEPPQEVVEHAGGGVVALTMGKRVAVGSHTLMAAQGIQVEGAAGEVFVSVDGILQGSILISDVLKEDSAAALQELRDMGIKTVMVTGDNKSTAEKIGSGLALSEIHAELLPDGKVEVMERLLQEKGRGTVAFVGDGINDAPVLARADIGVAMGSLGSDAAIEAADVVIMNDNLTKLPAAVRLSRRTMRIVRQNIVFSLVIKLAVLVLGAVGIAGMWDAVFADVGVSVLAVLNAMRAMRKLS